MNDRTKVSVRSDWNISGREYRGPYTVEAPVRGRVGVAAVPEPKAAEQAQAQWAAWPTALWFAAWLAAPVTTATFLLGRWLWRKWK